MPSMGDDFSLTKLYINTIDASSNLVQLTANPDDVEARGLDVTFLVADEPLNMLDCPSVVFVWRHNEQEERQGSVKFDQIDAAVGRWKVYYPVEMLVPGTVTASIEVTRDGRNFAMRLPTITVINEQLNFQTLPEGDTFGMFAAALLQLQKDTAEIELVITEAKTATNNANTSASLANEAAQRADEAVNNFNRITSEVDNVISDAQDAAKVARDARKDVDDALANLTGEDERAENEKSRQEAEAKREENATRALEEIAETKALTEAATENANLAAESASEAATSALDAGATASGAAENATNAANAANEAAQRVDDAIASIGDTDEKAKAAEAERETAETARATAETEREKAEIERSEAETSRAQAEQGRADAETERAQAEKKRETDEQARADAEELRVQAETERVAAETTRAEAESARVEAETERENWYEQTKASVEAGDLNGATFTPSVAENGDLSWTNDKELANPETVNIKGEKGDTGDGLTIFDTYETYEALTEAHPQGSEKGEAYIVDGNYYLWNGSEWKDAGKLQGAKGDDGPAGPEGAPGAEGPAGAAGKDGGYYVPSVSEDGELTWQASAEDMPPVDAKNIKGPKGDPGEDGKQGLPGENATTTELSSEAAPGLLRQLSGKEDQVLLGTGEWGEYHGGGGSAGPIWLEVDENGDLNAYYDDNLGAPNLEYNEAEGNLYAIFETEGE